jgi:uncharacterized protein YkwD
MQRPSRVLIAGVLAVVLGGGSLLTVQLNGSTVGSWFGHGDDAAQGVYAGPLLAMQGPATLPSRAPGPGKSKAAGKPATSASKPATPKPTSTPKPSVSPKPTHTTPAAGGAIVSQLLAQINQLRADHHLPPYALSSGLDASAHKHNLTMTGPCGMSHQCPGEASLGDRISAQGVHWTSCGENIGYSGPHANTTSALIAAAEGLTTAMYDEKPPDDGHRLNLLSTQFHHVGIDVVRDSSGTVWLTQDFSS